MVREATYGSPSSLRVPACNISTFLFSNPFREDGIVVTSAPLASQREHYLKEVVPPHKPLFINPQTGAQASWSRVYRDTRRIARGLRTLPFLHPAAHRPGNGGIVVSPIVMVHLPNLIVYGPVLFGIWAAGLTASTVNPFLTKGELAHVLQVSRPQAVITLAGAGVQTLKDALAELGDAALQHHYQTSGCIFVVDPDDDDYGVHARPYSQPRVPGWKVSNWKTLLGNDQPGAEEFNIPPMTLEEAKARIALVMWSSGTSGKSKGVAVSHYSIVYALSALWHISPELGPDERFLAVAPVYHSFGITVTLLTTPLIGVSTVMVPKFELRSFLNLVSKFRITVLHIAPPIALLLTKSPIVSEYDVTSVRRAISGGAPLGQEIIEQLYERTGIMVSMGLGMTEACGAVSMQCGLSWAEMQAARGSTGRFVLGTEVKFVDETGKTVNFGEPGELYVRSPANFTCYLNDVKATNEALTKDGWYRTGDVGRIDEMGNMYTIDRLKDVIKYKGLQVAPAELEAILCASPLVKEAAVTSVYSAAEATELPRAYIVPSDASLATGSRHITTEQARFADDVRRHVEEHAVKYKWLRGGIVIVKEVPISAAGKKLRKFLKGLNGTEIPLYTPSARL